jgi:transposase
MARQYVGIDFHRRRSVIVRMDARGKVLASTRIENDPATMARTVGEAGPGADVTFEATYGWYWLADLLKEEGHRVHMAHPLAMKGMTTNRRVKTDWKDATLLADVLRMGSLPEGWIAPPQTRELRELVRYRAKLMLLRHSFINQIHSVMAKNGILPAAADLLGPTGTVQLDALELPDAYTIRIESLRDMLDASAREVAMLDRQIHRRLASDPGYKTIQTIDGVGRVLGAVFVAEIGDVSRFSTPDKLCSWAGVTPKHRESDKTRHQGDITKQGSRLVRWAAVEAATGRYRNKKLRADFNRIAERRGKRKAQLAVARKLLILVYYGLRDGHIRALDQAAS